MGADELSGTPETVPADVDPAALAELRSNAAINALSSDEQLTVPTGTDPAFCTDEFEGLAGEPLSTGVDDVPLEDMGYALVPVLDEAGSPINGPDGNPLTVYADAEGNPEVGADGEPVLRNEAGEAYTANDFQGMTEAAMAAQVEAMKHSALNSLEQFARFGQLAHVGAFRVGGRSAHALAVAFRTEVAKNGLAALKPGAAFNTAKTGAKAAALAATESAAPASRTLAQNSARAGMKASAVNTIARMDKHAALAAEYAKGLSSQLATAQAEAARLTKAAANTKDAARSAKLVQEAANAGKAAQALEGKLLKATKYAEGSAAKVASFFKSQPAFVQREIQAARTATKTAGAAAKISSKLAQGAEWAQGTRAGGRVASAAGKAGAAVKGSEVVGSAGNAARYAKALLGTNAAVARIALEGTPGYKAASAAAAALKSSSVGVKTAEAAGKVATAVSGSSVALKAGKFVGRAVPGLSIGIAAMDTGIAVKTLMDDKASGGKKALAVGTAVLSGLAAGASHIPFIGNLAAVGISAGVVGLSFLRDKVD